MDEVLDPTKDTLPEPSPPAAALEEDEESLDLGDRVIVLGGRYNKTVGRIYYLDENLMRMLPENLSDRLVDVPIIDGDLDPALGIDKIFVLSKRAHESFVVNADIRVGQIAETYTARGDIGPVFKVVSVDEDEDIATFEDETGAIMNINFNFRGVPREYESSFAVIRCRQAPAKVSPLNETAPAPVEDEDELIIEEYIQPEAAARVEEIVEIPVILRKYDDIVQRNSMFQDLMAALSDASRRSEKQVKNIRKLVETFMILRNEVTNYTVSGDTRGLLPTSYETIGELVAAVQIPLARPILSAKRVLQLDETGDENPSEADVENVVIKYLRETVVNSVEFQNTQLGGIQSSQVDPNGLPKWYLTWELYFNKFFNSWIPTGDGDETVFTRAQEFFRGPVNDLRHGLPRLDEEVYDKKQPLTSEYAGTAVKYGLLRATGPRYTRIKQRDGELKIESGDSGVVENTLIFPLSTERDLGTNRSGRIIYDIVRGKMDLSPIEDIIERLGGISDVATAGSILNIGEGGNTNGMILIQDWLESQPLYAEGFGDVLFDLLSFGLSQKEFTLEQQEVIVKKINNTRAIIKKNIASIRNEAQKPITAVANTSFLQGQPYQEFIERLRTEPILAEQMETLYNTNDIAITGRLMSTARDLFITVLAGVAGPLAQERSRQVRQQFLDALRTAMRVADKKTTAGDLPQPNRCPHVTALVSVRKIKDDTQRLKVMAKFITQYNGGKQDNWLNCIKCEEHLLCAHEFLQLQEFLRPREKDTIHKEILLAFSGGQFHGRYMCKNCGQAISTMDFDTNLEYDDNGNPLMGRAVLVDKDAIAEEEMDLLLSTDGVSKQALEFTTDTQTLVYNTAKQIFERVGINAEDSTYRRIVSRVEAEILKQPTRKQYAKLQTSKKVSIDYDIYLNRILVAATGANCLVEVQTHVPGYILQTRMPQCIAGFTGYPIDSEGDDLTGVTYISCAIASISTAAAPWTLTGFQLEPSMPRRIEIVKSLVKKLTEVTAKLAEVQQQMIIKRSYLLATHGRLNLQTDVLSEKLPFRFLPAMLAKDEVVVPDSAVPMNAVRGWMAIADKYAMENSDLVKGSQSLEASCCFKNINEPAAFWMRNKLPDIDIKEGHLGPIGSHLTVHMVPRRPQRISADIPDSLFYKVFLKVCYDGPRKGLPHEPGYNRTCPHCGFVFQTDPYDILPGKPLNRDLAKEYDEETVTLIQGGKAALLEQGVVMDRDAFDSVLDESHLRNRVPSLQKIMPKSGIELLEELAEMEPEPFEGWRILMAETIEGVSRLPPDADEVGIAVAFGPLSTRGQEFMDDLFRRIGNDNSRTLQNLLQQSPQQIAETLHTYVLVTFQRLLCGFKSVSLLDNIKRTSFGQNIIDDLKEIINGHMAMIATLRSQKHIRGFVMAKLEHTRNCLGRALSLIQKNVRASHIPGGMTGLPYIINTLIVGIFDEFANPNIIPRAIIEKGIRIPQTVDKDARASLIILSSCLEQLQKEGMNLTEQEIADEIERRTEMERRLFTRRGDTMTPEEKQVFLMNKRMGLGEFAVGGTRAIRAYDEEQYERDRQQRNEMGYTDANAEGDAGDGYDVAQDAEENF
jgi:hypothetical protein